MASPKRLCIEQPVIGTHDGKFHCDEALACYLLKQLKEFSSAKILRTRDKEKLSQCSIVVDVGGVYDPHNHRYDHHQRDFAHSMSSLNPDFPWTTKLSSAGLVYFHFGHQIITNAVSDSEAVNVIFRKIYEGLIEEVDAIDNGISACDHPRYRITTNLSSRVSFLNPAWNEVNPNADERFLSAVELVGREFEDRLHHYSTVWWPARKLVAEALGRRHEVDPGGRLLLLERWVPWHDHLTSMEQELDCRVDLVLFRDSNAEGAWRVQSVPAEPGSFQSRAPMPEPWRGLRDKELSDVAGIPDCVFVHASGFICGNRCKEGALQMARKTLEYWQRIKETEAEADEKDTVKEADAQSMQRDEQIVNGIAHP